MTSLQLTNVNMQKSSNAQAHRTESYMTTESVFRRGQSFRITCTFNKPVQSGDRITITVETGPSPSEPRNTKAVMPVSSSGSPTAWSVVRGSSSTNSIPMTINCPVNAIVGRYQMKIQTTSGGRTWSSNMGTFIVLFNPWASGDQCYMPNEAEKNEYLLNEYGLYWFGNANNFDSRGWDYGQFESDMLDICLNLLDRSSFYASDKAADVSRRGDPVHVGRMMTAMVNSNDGDQGVIVGNWSSDYSGGQSPTFWNGSAPILRQWMRSGPVKYGQCWVYAGVLCTVLRCLGIAARTIINFASAHDTDGNLTIDSYYNSDGTRNNSRTDDSIWNFHAWVEMYCARPDLAATFNGWQIVDATPQELSGGIFCLGPCPLKAVKEGNVDLPYDVAFVFAEVNADEKTYEITPQGLRLLYSTTSNVGRNTSTKAIGSFSRRDVTGDYKYSEGSAKEREIVLKAQNIMRPASRMAAFGMASMAVREEEIKPEFTGTFKNVETLVGKDLEMGLEFKSTTEKPMTVKVNMTATAVMYTNKLLNEILKDSQSVTLRPNEAKSISFKVPYSQYKGAITADNMIDVVAVCEDEMTGKLLISKVVKLKSPPLLMKNNEEAKVNKTTTVEIIFTNPLNEDVPESLLSVEGSGLMKEPAAIKAPLIKKGESYTFKIKIHPYRSGPRCLMADLTSKQIPNVKAYLSIPVAP